MPAAALRVTLMTLLLGSTAIVSGCSAGATDPCAVALAGPAGNDPADRVLQEIRDRARTAANPVPYVERLGWAWIAREATSHDHGDFDRALQAAACMESHAPGHPDASLLRAHALVSMHRFREGEAVARELADRSPSWMAFAILGDAVMEQGRVQEAAVHYQMMADENPGSQAWSRAAHLRWLLGDREGAVAAMLVAAQTGGTRDARAAAWYRARLASYMLEAGRPDEARRFIDAALVLAPDLAPALLLQGRLLLAEGRPQEAIAPLRRAVAADPLPEHLWALHEALIDSGMEAEAAAIEKRLITEGDREDPRSLALYLAACGHDTERAVDLALAELQSRQDPLTLDAAAAALAAAGRIAEARDYARRALADGTRAPRLALHAASIAAADGDQAEAAIRIEQATEMSWGLLPSERRQLEALRAATSRRHPPEVRPS